MGSGVEKGRIVKILSVEENVCYLRKKMKIDEVLIQFFFWTDSPQKNNRITNKISEGKV